jgi:hypothetical protein
MTETIGTGNDAQAPGRVSGRKIVALMLGFGVVMVAALWLYWELHTRPFRPLQNAIAAEFPDSRPGVIGGRHKSHKSGNPQTLRIVIWIDFDPHADEERAENYGRRLAALAAEHHDLSNYDALEVRLVQRVGDSDSQMWSESRPIAEWNVDSPAPSSVLTP